MDSSAPPPTGYVRLQLHGYHVHDFVFISDTLKFSVCCFLLCSSLPSSSPMPHLVVPWWIISRESNLVVCQGPRLSACIIASCTPGSTSAGCSLLYDYHLQLCSTGEPKMVDCAGLSKLVERRSCAEMEHWIAGKGKSLGAAKVNKTSDSFK